MELGLFADDLGSSAEVSEFLVDAADQELVEGQAELCVLLALPGLLSLAEPFYFLVLLKRKLVKLLKMAIKAGYGASVLRREPFEVLAGVDVAVECEVLLVCVPLVQPVGSRNFPVLLQRALMELEDVVQVSS